MNGFDDGLMDILSVLSVVLQLKVMQEQEYQSDNDDIMEELQRQNKRYLERILRNQNTIIEKLNRLTLMVD